jgi:hypothetical protein
MGGETEKQKGSDLKMKCVGNTLVRIPRGNIQLRSALQPRRDNESGQEGENLPELQVFIF